MIKDLTINPDFGFLILVKKRAVKYFEKHVKANDVKSIKRQIQRKSVIICKK